MSLKNSQLCWVQLLPEHRFASLLREHDLKAETAQGSAPMDCATIPYRIRNRARLEVIPQFRFLRMLWNTLYLGTFGAKAPTQQMPA